MGSSFVRVALVAVIILASMINVGTTRGEVVVHVSTEGTWQWVEWDPRSKSDARTPASTRYDRYLILREDGTHEYWGRDSTGTYRITSGAAHVREMPASSRRSPGMFLLEIENWNLQVASFSGRDTLVLSPAGAPGSPQPIRRFVRAGPETFVAPKKPAARFRQLRLSPEIEYQEIEGQPDFYDVPPFPTLAASARLPEFARDAGIQGTVVLHVLVGTDGRVLEVRNVTSLTGLVDAARDAVRRSEFAPAIADGQPVAVWTSMAYRFQLP